MSSLAPPCKTNNAVPESHRELKRVLDLWHMAQGGRREIFGEVAGS